MLADANIEHIDHQRWLLNNGLPNDVHKDTLFMFGSIVHRDVRAVEVALNPEKKTVGYVLYLDSVTLKTIDLYERLSKSTSIIDLWRFKRLLKKEGNLNISHLLSKFVKDYCGSNWQTELELKDYGDYEEGFNKETETSKGNDRAFN